MRIAALACLVVSLPFVLLFVFAGGGAGDAKLMGAVGAWLGLGSGIVALGSVCAAGVAFAVVHALSRNRLRAALSNMAGLARAAWLFVGLWVGGLEVPGVTVAVCETPWPATGSSAWSASCTATRPRRPQ